MKEQIEKLYEKYRRGRLKAVIICVIAYFAMMGVVSMFLGSPFPHKTQILFMETMTNGWVNTHGYLLILCGIIGIIVGMGSILYQIIHDFEKFDKILLEECDTKKYLELMEYAVSYGTEIKPKDFQKSVFTLVQQRYVLALMAEHRFPKAMAYLQNHWQGKKTTNLYRNTALSAQLASSFENRNGEEFAGLYQKGEKLFRKNGIFLGKKLFLEGKYADAVELLQNIQKKTNYQEVQRQYMLAMCYEALKETEQASICMEYVAKYGNTTPCRYAAEQWKKENASVILSELMTEY